MVDEIGGFLLHVLQDALPLGQLIEVFKHLNGVFDRRNVGERLGDDCRIDDLNVLHILLEHLAIVVMPTGDLHVKDVILELLDALQMLIEHSLQVLERESPFLALCATEDRHLAAGSTLGELQLALADFLEVLAPLDEGLILGKDAIILVPSFLGILDDALLNLCADLLPLLAAFDALVEVSHALFNVTAKHVLAVDFAAASLVDLVADLGQEALHALWGRIVVTQLPNYAHCRKHIRHEAWDLSGLGLLNLAAGVLEDLEELQVAGSLIVADLYLVLQGDEAGQVGALDLLEHLDDPEEFGVDQAQGQSFQIGRPVCPVLDFVERARVVMACLRAVLVRDQLLDLARPVDDDRLETLEQVLVFLGCVDVAEVLIRDVQVLHALGNVAGLSDHGHEVVQVRDELFLYVFGPVVLSE